MENKKIHAENPTFCHRYFNLVPSENLMEAFEKSEKETLSLIDSIPKEIENFAYSPGKWTLKEVVKHIIETERIFAYRAFRFSRKDTDELKGFDENKYIAATQHLVYDLQELKEAFIAVRSATVSLYKNMDDAMLDFVGKANQATYTARGIGFMIVGHNLHHLNIIKERYLVN